MVGDGCQISHDSLNPSCKLKRESWDGATDGDVMDQKLIMILTETEKRTALIGRWFRRLQFARVDLAGAVFRKADLEGTRFMLADLHEADFRQANLRGAEFSLCDLYGADFTDACKEAAQARDAFVAQLDQIKDQLREKKRSEHHRRAGEAKVYVQREITILEARQAAVKEELRAVEAQITEDTAAHYRAEEAAPTQAEERQRATAAQIAATKDVLRAAQEERGALTSGITPFVLSEYERIFTHRGGVAVVAIEHETCQGCYLHVPAHLCLELRKTPRLAFCPNCHRILFVANEAPISRLHSHRPAANKRPTRRPQRYTQAVARNGKTVPATTSQTAPVHV